MLEACRGQVPLQQQPGYQLHTNRFSGCAGGYVAQGGDTVRAEDYNFFCGKGNENYHLGAGILYTTVWYQQLRE
jgi:hypothetical protein